MRLATSAGLRRLALALLGLPAAGALAQAPPLLSNPTPAAHESFGIAVDVDGDVAIVGAPTERVGGVWTGGAYVYRLQTDGTWALEATLRPATHGAFDLLDFGHRVAISGDVAVVTAPGEWNRNGTSGGDDDTRGSVYVYRRQAGGTWALETELAQAPFGDALYGLDVDVEGDALVVGVKDRFVGPPGQGPGGGARAGGNRPTGDICSPNGVYEPGRAEVLRYDGAAWVRTDSLVAPDSLLGSGYGLTVSLDDDVVAVGAPLWYTSPLCGDPTDADEIGRAYVFRRTGTDWALEATLAPADLEPADQFGFDVVASGNRVLAGAPYRDGAAVRSGAAFSFAYDGAAWGQEAEFVGQNTLDGDYFGSSVDLRGDYAVVGAPRYRNGDLNLGATYGFRYAGGAWQQGLLVTYDVDLSPSNPVPINFAFGAAVALDAAHVFIGAPEFGDYDGPEVAPNVGAAFAYALPQFFQLVVAGDAGPAGGPPTLSLGAAAPNPARGRTSLALALGTAADVRVAVYDALGREVAVVHAGPLAAGGHRLALDTAALPAGAYVLRATAGAESATGRLTVVR